jgi:hypothetical protein
VWSAVSVDRDVVPFLLILHTREISHVSAGNQAHRTLKCTSGTDPEMGGCSRNVAVYIQ